MVPDIVVFDGVCNLCTRSVQFILRHEAGPHFQFAPLQSPAGARLLKTFGFSPDDAKTFVLIVDGKPYVKSDAAIRVAKYFKGPWKLVAIVRVIPRPIRNWIYDAVARNRYRWFGTTETCMVPTPELRSRFLEE
jgi:predicted DCC family thiol-disulfide oxidoreductase YuxK